MKQIEPGIYEENGVRVFASEHILPSLQQDKTMQQARNVSQLPGILGPSIVMPDAHQGYGFSIGGVAAFDAKEGIISPGGIGFDINCGVRLLATTLTRNDIKNVDEVLEKIAQKVPTGKGKEGLVRLTHQELDEVLEKGLYWAKEKGYATDDDIACCEAQGCLVDADATKVSPRAKKRGKNQLGTLGAGNHFIELQIVENIFDGTIAKPFGLQKDQVVVMIHSGSRGIGHQTCSEYLRKMEEEHPAIADSLPERDLMYAPLSSQVAKEYFAAMCACANFAWVNRFMMGYHVTTVLQELFDCNVTPVYDVAHNIAKKELHTIDGKKREVMVHRKGATRAFPAGHTDVPKRYAKTGHPVLIPGSMGTPSFVLVGTQKALDVAYGSTAHGSGRVMSRKKAIQTIDSDDVRVVLQKKGIHLHAPHNISDEAPQVYKDSTQVVHVSELSGIGKIIVRLQPFGVIKG